MGIFTADGTRVTKATVPTTTPADPLVEVTETLYSTRAFDSSYGRGGNDRRPEGSIRSVAVNAGTVLHQSALDKLFPVATVADVEPATGPAAGGTTVVLTGRLLDGVTAVTVGGAAATEVTVLGGDQVQFVTPVGTAGARDVVLTDDAGEVTLVGGFVYTA